jgi:hypothetical protein
MADELNPDPGTSKINIGDAIKNVVTIAGAVVALASSTWAVFVPIADYFDEKRKTYEVKLSSDMITLVNNLDDSSSQSKVDNSILMLSAYENDAIPYLLYKLEGDGPSEKEAGKTREVIIRALQIIKNKKSVDKDEMMTLIHDSAHLYFMLNNSPDISPTQKETIYDYIKLLSLVGCDDKKKIFTLYAEMKNEALLTTDTTESYFKTMTRRIDQGTKLLNSKCKLH